MKLRAILAFTFVTLFLNSSLNAQAPSTCFEIESILVDACGSPEGENEMVRLYVGPSDLNVNDISIDWPSNNFLGICQNSTTANKISQLNAGINGCGLLLEPTSGILPAESKVLILTSTDFDVNANSFANLNDTLYVIFQCSGNTAGHFANYNSSSGLRTLEISFSSPGGCSDEVTYDRSNLVNQAGVTGGSSADRDGARVDFSWNGTPSYANDACQAPIEISTVEINESSPTICPGNTIDLTSTLQGSFQSILWSGGNGTFSSPNGNNTSYYSNSSDNVDFNIYLNGITSCNDTIKDTLEIQISNSGAMVSITSPTNELCSGDSILLTANGSGNYSWSNGSSNNSIFVNQAGIYSVISTTGCGTASDSIIITEAQNFTMTLSPTTNSTICDGESVELTVSGAPNYTWFNGETDTIETVNTTGNYYVIGYNQCYSDSQSINVNVINNFSLTLSSSTNAICSGDSAILTATGAPNYTWFNNATSNSQVVSSPGDYYVIGYNECFTDSQSVNISVQDSFTMELSASETSICSGETSTLTATGAPNYTWFNNNSGNSETVSAEGDYYVIGYNSCFQDSQSIFIEVIPDLNLSITSSSPTNEMCGLDSITLTASGNGSFLWNTSDTSKTIVVTSPGTYYVTASNSCDNNSESIIIYEGDTPNIEITGDSVICNNSSITLTASGADTYEWSTGSQVSNINISSEQGVYVIGSTSCGTDSAYFFVYDHSVVADFTSNYTEGMFAPSEINFTNLSSGQTINSWSFGDGSSSTENNPVHTFLSDGIFNVSITASNEYCSDTYQEELIFDIPVTIFVPNVFTPNGDSINDYFTIKGDHIEGLSCKIFNRWGEELYQWNDVDGNWDGTYKGNLVSDGTYFYILEVIWQNGDTETLNGHITVLKD